MTYPPETPPPPYPPEAPPAYAPQKTMSTYPSPAVQTPPGFGADPDSDSSTADAAKEQAAAVKDTAAQAGQQVADVAKNQVANVAEQTKYEAKHLLNQTRDELSSQAGTQQQRVAGGLRSLGSELQSMASKSDSDGPAAEVARQAADRIHTAAGWLENRDPGQVMTEVQRFARQRPGAFLAIAAVAGLAVGRLTRGLAADSSSDDSTNSTGSGAHRSGLSDQSAGTTSGSLPPDNGWQGIASAPDPGNAYGMEYGSAQPFDAPPPSTGWTQEQPPLSGSEPYGIGTGTVGDPGTETGNR